MADVRNFPIPVEVFYVFALVVSLLVASVSALILLDALGKGDKAQAWISETPGKRRGSMGAPPRPVERQSTRRSLRT